MKNIFKTKGRTRIVFLFPKLNIVIKVPTLLNGYEYFLHGILTNHRERKIFKLYKSKHLDKIDIHNSFDKLAPTLFSFFGLFNIQRYVHILSTDDMDETDIEYFKHVTNDFYYRNFGYYSTVKLSDETNIYDYCDDLKLVCVDYGNVCNKFYNTELSIDVLLNKVKNK